MEAFPWGLGKIPLDYVLQFDEFFAKSNVRVLGKVMSERKNAY